MATGQYNNNNPNNQNGNRGRRPANGLRRQQVPGAVIAIYVMMAVLILAICALIFVVTLKATGWNGENQSDPSGVVLSSPEQGSSDLWISVDQSSSENDSSYDVIYSKDDSSDIDDPSSDDPDSDSSDVSGVWVPSTELPTDYDPAVFEDDLFIGDSIFTGLYLYEYLDVKNVAAKVGYTPYNALHKDFSQTYSGSAADYAKEMQPKRIFIMLGSNAMGAGTNYDAVVADYVDLVKKLKEDCKDSMVCVISVPPVTADSSAAANAGITNSNINSMNSKLKAMAQQNKVEYFDLNAMVSDNNGCFMERYAEMDGLHFKGATYKVLLSALQREVINAGG